LALLKSEDFVVGPGNISFWEIPINVAAIDFVHQVQLTNQGAVVAYDVRPDKTISYNRTIYGF
jgi:hypothetical protein